jgi:hypothetical protein
MRAARRSTGHAARTTAALALAAGLSLALVACGPESGPQQAGPGSSVTVTEPSSTSQPSTPTSGQTSTPSQTASPTDTPPPSPTGSPTSTPGEGETATPQAPTDDMLRPGDEGAEVLAMQKRLSELGYWLGTPDGKFGALTSQAVYALQGAAGLGRDGVVGPATQKALARGALPKVQSAGSAVEIDISQGTISFVRNGQPWRVLHTSTGNERPYQSGSGTAIAHTPRGSFSVQRRIDGVRVAPLGRLYRPVYFYRGYAVHGSGSIPPYPASHGCARVSNSAIDMIWRESLMPDGLRVLVRD